LRKQLGIQPPTSGNSNTVWNAHREIQTQDNLFEMQLNDASISDAE